VCGLKQALLKIKFNCKDECESFLIENLNVGKTYIHNIQIKSLLHNNINMYEEEIKDNKLDKLKGYPLLSIFGKPNRRILNPFLLLNKERTYFRRIFNRNIKYETKDKMNVLVILPSYIYVPIKLDINYSIYYPYNVIYSKDYCIDYSMWKINNFILLKFWNNIKESSSKKKMTKKIKRYM
jgi:hypothetical protein